MEGKSDFSNVTSSSNPASGSPTLVGLVIELVPLVLLPEALADRLGFDDKLV